MATDSPFLSGKDELAYIINRAGAMGVDAKAALAVAAHEGVTIPAQVGDSGSSFGPWQLHAGGALPADIWARGASYAKQWADSPAGIDYALAGIASVAKGEQGQQAITDIAYRFERPADPAQEVRLSLATYNAGGMPGVAGGGGGGVLGSITGGLGSAAGFVGGIPGDITGIPGDITGAIGGAVRWVENILVRGGKIMLGAGLVLVGLYLIARAFNAAPSPGQVATVVTRGGGGSRAASGGGAGAASRAPRRRGDAAAARGEAVTQAGQPRPTTRREARSDARQDRAAARTRQRQEASFGEVPF